MRSSVFRSGARHSPSSPFEVKRLLFAELLANGWVLELGDFGILFLPVGVFNCLTEFAVSFITLELFYSNR